MKKFLLIAVLFLTSLSLNAQCNMAVATYDHDSEEYVLTQEVQNVDVQVTFKKRFKHAWLIVTKDNATTGFHAIVLERYKEGYDVHYLMQNDEGGRFVLSMNKRNNVIATTVPEVHMELIGGEGLTIKAR